MTPVIWMHRPAPYMRSRTLRFRRRRGCLLRPSSRLVDVELGVAVTAVDRGRDVGAANLDVGSVAHTVANGDTALHAYHSRIRNDAWPTVMCCNCSEMIYQL